MKEEEKNTQEISQKEEKERTQDSDELLLKQIKSEMKISEDYMKNKRTKWNIQMNLMDNIKLNDEKI